MNAGTDKGQADGFKIDGLKSLKEIEDPVCSVLDLIVVTVVLVFCCCFIYMYGRFFKHK